MKSFKTTDVSLRCLTLSTLALLITSLFGPNSKAIAEPSISRGLTAVRTVFTGAGGQAKGNYVGGYRHDGRSCYFFRWNSISGTNDKALQDNFCSGNPRISPTGEMVGYNASSIRFGFQKPNGDFSISTIGDYGTDMSIDGINSHGDVVYSFTKTWPFTSREYRMINRDTGHLKNIYVGSSSPNSTKPVAVFDINDNRTVAAISDGNIYVHLFNPTTGRYSQVMAHDFLNICTEESACKISALGEDDSIVYSYATPSGRYVFRFDPHQHTRTILTVIENDARFFSNSRGDIFIISPRGSEYYPINEPNQVIQLGTVIDGISFSRDSMMGITENGIVAVQTNSVFALRPQTSAGRADFNFDGRTDTADLTKLIARIGKIDVGDVTSVDMVRGTYSPRPIDSQDLTAFLGQFGRQ